MTRFTGRWKSGHLAIQVFDSLGLKSKVHGNYNERLFTYLSSFSLKQSVRDDIEFIKRSPLVRKELADRTTGYIYDIHTGRLNTVV